MQTFEERKALYLETINSSNDLSLREIAMHTYYWVRYEFALRDRVVAEKKINKYENLLNADIKVFNFRHEMKKY